MIETLSIVSPSLLQCALSLPLFIILVIAGVMIAGRAENNRTAAWMALAGIALILIDQIVGVASNSLAPIMIRQGTQTTTIAAVYSVVGVVTTITVTASWGLVLAALVMALGRARSDEPT